MSQASLTTAVLCDQPISVLDWCFFARQWDLHLPLVEPAEQANLANFTVMNGATL